MTGPRPAGEIWTEDDDGKLLAMSETKTNLATIARKLKRTIGAIQARRAKLRRLARRPERPPPSSTRGIAAAGPTPGEGWRAIAARDD